MADPQDITMPVSGHPTGQDEGAGPDLPSGRLWSLLRTGSRSAHEALDQRIMAGNPFADLDRYGLFLQLQHDLHAAVSPLYQDPALGTLLPDLPGRDRLAAVRADLADLGQAVPATVAPDHAPDPHDRAKALGWLYVAEGSNLGAAFLLKIARGLGLSESHGARHMAPAEAGRGLHWRNFTAAMDKIALTAEEEARAVVAAREAFAFVQARVAARLPNPASAVGAGPKLATG